MNESTAQGQADNETGNPMYWGAVPQTEFPLAQTFYSIYKKHFHVYEIDDLFQMNEHFFKWFSEKFSVTDNDLIYRHNEISKKKTLCSYWVYNVPELKSFVCFWPRNEKDSLDNKLGMRILASDVELISSFINEMKQFMVKRPIGRANNISLIIQRGSSLDTEDFPIKIGKLDIGLNYGDSFVKVYNNIVKRLNTKNDKGIVLLHGLPGTGKTSLIKHLVKKVKKEILFVSPSMVDSICSPSFLPFMMDHANSVLVIEDAERILQDRAIGGNQGVSNILNLSDGIMGDCLNIQIIATFNTDLKNIDEALLRKGRLIAEHQFKPLSVSDSNRLLKHLNKNHTTDKPMPLTDIYNIDVEVHRDQTERSSVGFNRR